MPQIEAIKNPIFWWYLCTRLTFRLHSSKPGLSFNHCGNRLLSEKIVIAKLYNCGDIGGNILTVMVIIILRKVIKDWYIHRIQYMLATLCELHPAQRWKSKVKAVWNIDINVNTNKRSNSEWKKWSIIKLYI